MDGKPLQDVTVYVDGLPVTATDISGQYRLSGLKQDQISLRVEKTGYAFVPESVSVKLPVSADVNFKGNLQTIPAVTASVIPVNILSTIQPVGETPQQPHNPDVVEGLFLLAILALLLGALSLYYRRTSEEVTPSAEEQPSPQAESEPITQRRQAPDVLVIEKSLPLEPEQETSAVPEPDLEDLILNGSAPTADDPLADVFQQGTTAVKAGRYQEGIELLSLYVRQAQSNSDAWLWLGVSAMQMGDLILARNCFKQAQWLGHPQAVKALEELAKRSPHNHTSNL
jgi:hypothetical protein